MSEKKTKIKKIIVCILIVAVITSAVCVFFVAKNKKKKNNNNEPIITPVNQSSIIESQINSDILNKKICADYDGNYIYYNVADISFSGETTYTERSNAYNTIANVSNKNSFLRYIKDKKNYDSTSEIITLVNGKYTKTISRSRAENGLYFGNENKSVIYTRDNNGSIEIDEKLYSISLEISITGYWLSSNIKENISNIEKKENISLIYIREKFKYSNNDEKYLYVTYVYKITDICPTCAQANYIKGYICDNCGYIDK